MIKSNDRLRVTRVLLGIFSITFAVCPNITSAFGPQYFSDFSSDPDWITDQPGNYYWDGSQQRFHATTDNAQPSTSPTRYAFTTVDYGGESIRLTFDIQLVQLELEAGVHFGLFDESLWIGVSAAPGSPDTNFFHVHPARRLNGDLVWTLRVRGLNGIEHVEQIGLNLYSEGLWYRCAMTFDSSADSASLTITERDSGDFIGAASVSNIGGLPNDLDFLGFARDPVGHCCPPVGSGCSEPAWCVGAGTAYLDNVRLSQLLPGNVPTVSNWGMIIMGFLVLTAGTVLSRNKSTTFQAR
jgi:hypothetical protein